MSVDFSLSSPSGHASAVKYMPTVGATDMMDGSETTPPLVDDDLPADGGLLKY
jgi:hypothetical protein